MTKGLTKAKLLLLLLVLLPCCRQAPPKPEPMTDEEREALVDLQLEPVANAVKNALGGRKTALAPLYKEGTKMEPRVSLYVGQRLTRQLLQAGAALVERRDLDRVMAEQSLQHSDLFDGEKRVELGRIIGAETLITGTVKDLALDVYRIQFKVLEVETGEILAVQQVDLSRKLLPVSYGGR